MVATTTTKSANSKVKTVLVTGATSMVGKELVKRLSTNSKNIRIKAAGRLEEKLENLVHRISYMQIRLLTQYFYQFLS
jgi:NADP-dependent 3-hydroxy acid dehydrogenase YdfG